MTDLEEILSRSQPGSAQCVDMNLSQAQQATQRQPSLATKATRGSLWVAVGKYVNYTISFISGIFIARLLKPEDFGTVALATATFGILSRMKSVGIGIAIIQRPDDDPVALSTLFWVHAGITMAIFLLALPIALFSGLFDALTAKIFLIIAAFRTARDITYPAAAMLRKHFQFKQLTMVDVVFDTLSLVTAVAMAYLGFGVWVLVWPSMIGLLLKGLLRWRLSRWRPQFVFDWDVVRALKRFSVAYFLFGVLEEFVHKIDDVLLGKLGGTTSLGFYSKAYNTSEMFHVNVSGVIATTALPLFSRYQNDPQRLRRAYELVIKMALKLGGLFYITLAVVAYEVVGLLYGQKWLPLVPILWAMLPYALILPTFELNKYLLVAVGLIDDVARAFALMAGVLLVALIPGILLFGAIGAAIAVDAMIVAGLVYKLVKIRNMLEVDVSAILYKPVGLMLIQGLLLVMVKQFLLPADSWLAILVIGGISVGLFAVSVWAFDRSWLLNDVRSLYLAARGRPIAM